MAARLVRRSFSRTSLTLVLSVGLATLVASVPAGAAQTQKKPLPQQIDQEYTAKIKEFTQDPRVITELVDHMPASATVPSPLKFLGRIPGTPAERCSRASGDH